MSPAPDNILDIILNHYDDMIDYYGDHKGVSIARKHLAWYVSGMSHANEFREAINKERDPNIVKMHLVFYLKDRLWRHKNPRIRLILFNNIWHLD